MQNQKEEAAKRLQILVSNGLHPVVADNLEEDLLTISYCPLLGFPILCDFESGGSFDQSWIDEVKKMEDKYGFYVYHVIYSCTSVVEMLSLLYVSPYEEEWEIERNELICGYPISYVVNLNHPEFSERGSIGIKITMGGITRTG